MRIDNEISNTNDNVRGTVDGVDRTNQDVNKLQNTIEGNNSEQPANNFTKPARPTSTGTSNQAPSTDPTSKPNNNNDNYFPW